MYVRTQIRVLCPPPPYFLNVNYPSVVYSYLPIGHPGHDIPPPDLGGLIVVFLQNFWTPAAVRAARDL